jgi:glycosyltransferase involved in cell wall biosynthesis
LARTIYKNRLKPAVFRRAMRQFIRSSWAIITPTQYVKTTICERYNISPAKVTVTYEAGELPGITSEPYAPLQNQSFILYVGNAYPYKNLVRLVKAWQLVAKADNNLVLVGKSDHFYEQLAALVAQQEINNVVITGFIPDEQLAWLYRHATALVFPSLSEGFGLPGLEAMGYGLPVISSNATCLPEVYGQAAHYFDPHSTEDMAAKITQVLDDPKLRESLATTGKKRVKDFSWEKMAKETLAVYREALASSRDA